MPLRKVFARRSSPISKLPNELLRDIFLRSRSQEDGSHPQGISTPWSSLFTVCNRWYRVALGMPELWDSLLIELDGKDDIQVLLPHLKLYLDCGNGGPLDITLCINDEDQFLSYHPVIDMLITSRSRWRNVSIHAHHSVLQFLRGGFPLLESLTLDAFVPVHDEAQELEATMATPNLHTLDLGKTTKFYSIFPSDASKLRRYVSSCDHPDHLYSLLSTATNLVSAEISLNCDDATETHFWLPRDIIKLPNLESLVITSKHLICFNVFLPFLRVPSLVKLHLRRDDKDPPIASIPLLFAAVFMLMHSSDCDLKEFGVSGISLCDEFCRLSLSMPNLRILTIGGPSIPAVLSSLVLILGRDDLPLLPPLLPRLEEIHIDWHKGANIFTETFRSWLQRQIQTALVARRSQSPMTKTVAAARALLTVKEQIYRRCDVAIWGFFFLLVFVDLARALYHVYTQWL